MKLLPRIARIKESPALCSYHRSNEACAKFLRLIGRLECCHACCTHPGSHDQCYLKSQALEEQGVACLNLGASAHMGVQELSEMFRHCERAFYPNPSAYVPTLYSNLLVLILFCHNLIEFRKTMRVIKSSSSALDVKTAKCFVTLSYQVEKQHGLR
jgi:hypothetical protein